MGGVKWAPTWAWQYSRGELDGLQFYLWAKGGLGKACCDFFSWLGSYCQKWILLGLKLGLKNVSLLAPDRDASWNLGNCFTAVFGRKFWLSKLQHDWYVLFGFLRIFLYSHDSNPFEFFLQTMCLYGLTSIALHWIFWRWAVEDGGVFFHCYHSGLQLSVAKHNF